MIMTITVALSVATTTWINLFNVVLNGTGKIRLQMYAWLLASLLNIPISIFFADTLGLGAIGIILGTTASLLPLVIISPLQVHKILSKTDRGIWEK